MHLSEIMLVFMHQMRGLVREWRAFVVMLGFCILTNGFIVYMHQSGDKQLGEVQGEKVKIGLAATAASLSDMFDDKEFTTTVIPAGMPGLAVKENKVAVEIHAPLSFASWASQLPLKVKKSPLIELYYDSGRLGGIDAFAKTRSALTSFVDRLTDKDLQAAGVQERWRLSIKYLSAHGKHNRHPNKQMSTGGMLTTLIVYTIALLVSTFGIYFLNEEYKKKTFVLLLLSPTSKASMVAANCLATIVTSGSMFLISYASTIWLLHQKINPLVSVTNFVALQPPDEANWLGPLLSIPLLAISSAIAVFGSTFVRAAKQAAIFTGLQIGIMELLAAAIFLPKHTVNMALGLIPISGNAVCISDALVGVIDGPLIALSSLMAFAYTFVLLYWASKRLSKLSTLENIVRDAN